MNHCQRPCRRTPRLYWFTFLVAVLLIVPGAGMTLPRSSGQNKQASPTKAEIDQQREEEKLREQWNSLSEQKARDLMQQHLRTIVLAMHDYWREHGSLPSAIVPNDEIEANHRLSGFVLLLPYLAKQLKQPELEKLYKSMDLTKAWDDPVNLKAAKTLVPVFLAPWTTEPFRDEKGFAVAHFAFVRGAKGEDNGAFPGETVCDLAADISGRDGTSTTLALGQISQQLGPWTAAGVATSRYMYHPDDIDPVNPAPTFSSHFPDGCPVAFCDATTRFLRNDLNKEIRYGIATRAGSEPIPSTF